MGYDLFLVNHTKKQIVGSKRVGTGFEDYQQVQYYLSLCCGDSFTIVGEDAKIIEDNVYGSVTDYKYINLSLLPLSQQDHGWGLTDEQRDRLW